MQTRLYAIGLLLVVFAVGGLIGHYTAPQGDFLKGYNLGLIEAAPNYDLALRLNECETNPQNQ